MSDQLILYRGTGEQIEATEDRDSGGLYVSTDGRGIWLGENKSAAG